jgi:hypothetical protein
MDEACLPVPSTKKHASRRKFSLHLVTASESRRRLTINGVPKRNMIVSMHIEAVTMQRPIIGAQHPVLALVLAAALDHIAANNCLATPCVAV